MSEDIGRIADGDRAGGLRPEPATPSQPIGAHPLRGCPFDTRLARTPYLVLPKLAIQAMPLEWRERFDAMLQDMEDVGLVTPEYHVFRDDGQGSEFTRARIVNEATGFVRLVKGRDDPWANYRYGDAKELSRSARA